MVDTYYQQLIGIPIKIYQPLIEIYQPLIFFYHITGTLFDNYIFYSASLNTDEYGAIFSPYSVVFHSVQSFQIETNFEDHPINGDSIRSHIQFRSEKNRFISCL